MMHFLRFESEDIALQYFKTAGFFVDDSLILCTHDYSIDVIGQIIRGGEWDENGNIITPPVVLDGWHVNFMGALPEAWEPFLVSPKNPVRVFYI